MRANTSASQAWGSILLSLAVPISCVNCGCAPAALVGACEQPSASSEASGRIARSAAFFVRHTAVIEETGEAVPTLDHVIHGPGHGGVARQPGALGAHPVLKIGEEWRALLSPSASAREVKQRHVS